MNQDEWHSGLEQQRKREAERQRQQRAESAEHVVTPGEPNLEFVPCDQCKKRGQFELLCSGCLRNKTTIETLRTDWTEGFDMACRERVQAFREAAKVVCEHCEKGRHLRTSLRCGYEHTWSSFQKDCKAAAIHALADKESGG